MQTGKLFTRNGKHAVGIIVPQILFDCEGKTRQIFKSLQVIRVHAMLVEMLFVEGRMLIGALQALLHAFELQRRNLVT